MLYFWSKRGNIQYSIRLVYFTHDNFKVFLKDVYSTGYIEVYDFKESCEFFRAGFA